MKHVLGLIELLSNALITSLQNPGTNFNSTHPVMGLIVAVLVLLNVSILKHFENATLD